MLNAEMFGLVGEALALQFGEQTADRVELSWVVTPAVHQPAGIVHGGVHAWVVETVASLGAMAWLADRGTVVGVSNHTDFYRAVRAGRLVSTGTPVHRGRSQQVWMVESRDDDDQLVARGQVRLHNLYPR